MHLFEFSKTQMKTLTWLGVALLVAMSYTLIRDYRVRPSDRPHDWREPGMETYRPPLVLDINRTPADSLELIPGIGPVLAARIIEYRRRYGGIASVDSLINVRGIGPVKLDRIRKYLKVEIQ